MEKKTHLQEKILERMHDMGLTRRDLAERSGLSVYTIRDVMNMPRKNTPETINRICWALRMTPEELTGDADFFVYNDKEIDNFAENLKMLMAVNFVNQTDLQKTLHFSKGSISLWINGYCKPSPSACVKLAKFFKIEPEDLFVEDLVEVRIRRGNHDKP